MNFIAFTDTHGSMASLKEIERKIKKFKSEFAICCGDFTTFENNMLTILKKFNKIKCKVYLIHGNHENLDNVKNSIKNLKNIKLLHKKIIVHKKYLIIGWGGGGFSYRDQEFEKWTKEIKNKIKEYKKKGKILIFVTHAPFFNTLLDKINGSHNGNKSLSKFIKKFRVHFAICGHFHENFNTSDKIKKTLLFNPGPRGLIIK